MLVFEQRLSARHLGRGVVLRARLVHGVEARGWRMKFGLLKAEVEIEADPETYKELANKLRASNVYVRPARRCEKIVTPKSVSSPMVVAKPGIQQPAILGTNNQMKPLYCEDGGDVKVSSPPCRSPGAILPDLPQEAEDPDKSVGLRAEASSAETAEWLVRNRFGQHAHTFANFSGADLLRLSREDIIQICGLADGIRLFNALHAKRIAPRLTLYVRAEGTAYSALFLRSGAGAELADKLLRVAHLQREDGISVLVAGPHGARVHLTDELVQNLPDAGTYRLERPDDGTLLLCPTPAHDN